MITGETLEEMGYSYYDRDPFPTTYPTPMEYVKNYYSTAGIEPDTITCATLIEEEYGEWYDWNPTAIGNGSSSTQEELKELADLVYAIYQYANARGWDVDEKIIEVHCDKLKELP